MTKREMFGVLKGIVETSDYEGKDEAIAFIDHEVELLNRKSGKATLTATQKANIDIMDAIVEALGSVDGAVTITEFQASVPAMAQYSNQKLSALLRMLVADGRVVKTVEKKRAYFTVA